MPVMPVVMPPPPVALVSPFPPNCVESTQPAFIKRRKMAARDIGQVDPWRVVMSLKTSLVADQNWAIDVLNVLLADDNAAGYFTLGCWPSLIDILCEIFRTALATMCEPLSDLVQNWEAIAENKQLVKQIKMEKCDVTDDGKVKLSEDEEIAIVEQLKKSSGLNGKTPTNKWGGGSHNLMMLMRAKQADVKNDDKTVILNGPKRKNYTWTTRRGAKVRIEGDDQHSEDESNKCNSSEVVVNGHNGDSNGDVEKTSATEKTRQPLVSKNNCIDSTVEANLRPADEWDVLKGIQLPSSKQVRLGISGCPLQALYISAPFRSSVLRRKMMKKVLRAKEIRNGLKTTPKKRLSRKSSKSPIHIEISESTKQKQSTDKGLLMAVDDEKPLVNGHTSPTPEVNSTTLTVEVGDEVKNNVPNGTSKQTTPQISPDFTSIVASKVKALVNETLPGPSFLPQPWLMNPSDSTALEYERIMADRCVALSNIIRNLASIPGNEIFMAKCWPLLHMFNRILSLRRHSNVSARKRFRSSDFLPKEEPMDDEEGIVEDIEDKEDEGSDFCGHSSDNDPWWLPVLGILHENVFVTLTYLAAEFELSQMPDEIVNPLIRNLFAWYIGESSECTDPFPDQSDPMLTPQRLTLETLCKLTVRPGNIDHLIHGPPFDHLIASLWTALGNLSMATDQVLKELVVVFLAALSQADQGVARYLALSPTAVVLLVTFIESTEQQCLPVCSFGHLLFNNVVNNFVLYFSCIIKIQPVGAPPILNL